MEGLIHGGAYFRNFTVTVRVRSLQANQGLGLRLPCNDQTNEFNKLFIIIWPFHYGPEPAINKKLAIKNWQADNFKKNMSPQ